MPQPASHTVSARRQDSSPVCQPPQLPAWRHRVSEPRVPGTNLQAHSWHPGLFAQQRVCQTHFPGSSPFLNQIHLIPHLYFGRRKNVISNLKFKKSSSSSKCTQLRWCLGNYLCHSHTHRHVAQQQGQAPPRHSMSPCTCHVTWHWASPRAGGPVC